MSQSHTESMAHIYMLFDFAKDEEKAQQARHKLETWKQAFRLDKKLLYKLERTEATAAPGDGDAKAAKQAAAKPEKSEKPKAKGKSPAKKEKEVESETSASNSSEDIRLLVRLGFSGHEKLTEQRWVDRIPSEEPFSAASPVVVKPGQTDFAATEQRFEDLA